MNAVGISTPGTKWLKKLSMQNPKLSFKLPPALGRLTTDIPVASAQPKRTKPLLPKTLETEAEEKTKYSHTPSTISGSGVRKGRGSQRGQGVNTPSTGVNVTTAKKDLSHITCFNCDQKGHYATKCPKSRKRSDASNSDDSSSDAPG